VADAVRGGQPAEELTEEHPRGILVTRGCSAVWLVLLQLAVGLGQILVS
jgi:hypothetical protein